MNIRSTHKSDTIEGKEPLILSVAGGKGGVGKSLICSNLAIQYAQAGLKVAILDLDFGAANLHTLFGIRKPQKGLINYFSTARSQLNDYFIPTEVENLFLAPCTGFVPENVTLKHLQKLKIIKHIKQLPFDLVLLDLGAGSSKHVVDFFSITHAGIVVTTPEPTAVMNAYEFLKNVMFRILFNLFRKDETIKNYLKTSTKSNSCDSLTISKLCEEISKIAPWATENIREIFNDLKYFIIFNQARCVNDVFLGKKLQDICEKHLLLDLNYPGVIFFDENVPSSIRNMLPISLSHPESITSQTLRRIAIFITSQLSEGAQSPSMDAAQFGEQLNRTLHYARKDYKDNYISQKRIEKEKDTNFFSSSLDF